MFRGVLMTAGCLFCLTVGSPSHADETQALARLKKWNVRSERDANLSGKPVIKIDLQGSSCPDADLANLKEFKQLRLLYLGYGTRTTDAGLVHLKDLTHLQLLYLPQTQVTDAGLVHLRKLVNLQKLGLNDCKGVTDRGLAALKGLKQLKDVGLYGTGVTEKGVAELQKALPNATIGGGRRLPPNNSIAAERARQLKAKESAEVSDEMIAFMSLLDGTEDGIGAALKKFAATSSDSFDLTGISLESPHVLKLEREGGMVCYTMQAKQGIAKGTYRLCWKDKKIRTVKQLSLDF